MTKGLCKVCGLTRAEDVLLCHELGVDFNGFIFAKKSPRCITPEQAAALPRQKALRVGVFVREDLARVQEIMHIAALDMVQLHGDEDAEYCRQIGAEKVIKVLWPARHDHASLLREMQHFAPVCSYFLLEAGDSGGGSGQTQDWAKLAHLQAPRPWLLAGGLGATNVAAAIMGCHPHGVDMNSALENSPGVKNHMLLTTASQAARTAFETLKS